MYLQIILLTIYTVFSPAPPVPPPVPTDISATVSIDKLIAQLPTGPSIARVQKAAIMQMQLHPMQTRKWLRRVRTAALLPEVRAEVDIANDRGWKLGQEAGTADELSEDQGAGRAFAVRASWHLDRLVFDVNELRVAQTGLDLQSARHRLLAEVTGLYYERLECLLTLELGQLPPDKQVQTWVRLQEITALLEGLTALAFPKSPSTRVRAPS